MKNFLFVIQLIMVFALTPLHAFDFENGDQEDLNKWVAKNGAEIYSSLNNNEKFGYPTGNKTSDYYTSSKHWESYSAFMEQTVSFIKKKGVSASVAHKSLLESEGRFDCRIAQRIVFLECILRLIGEECFDGLSQRFAAEPITPEMRFWFNGSTKDLYLDGPEYLNPYMRLTTQERGSLHRLGKIGYFGYVPNIAEYAALHPEGPLRGDNGLLCLKDTERAVVYTGYGDFYKQGAQPWDEMVTRFKKETLTLPVPKECIVDASKVREDRRESYIRMTEALHKAALQMKENLVKSIENTYEEKLQHSQRAFEGQSFFIDLKKIKSLLEI